MKHAKRYLSILVAIVMVFCTSLTVMATTPDNTMETLVVNTLDNQSVTASVDVDVVFDENSTYTYFDRTRGVTNQNDIIDIYDTLSASDAIDFHLFSLTSSRAVVARFLSENANYAANLGLYNPSTGDVTLSNLWLYPGDTATFTLGAGNYCWVVLSLNNTYTTGQYRLSMNARNASVAGNITVSGHIATSSNFSRSAFIYSNGDILLNGDSVYTKINNYIANQMSGTVFKGEHTGAAPTNRKVTAGVVTTSAYISGSVYYGGYTSTIPTTNPNTGMGYSSEHVVFIPIDGYSYTCTYSTNLIATQIFTGPANGFLVYDLISGKVIDWMSSSNLLYNSAYGGFSNSYSTYWQL